MKLEHYWEDICRIHLLTKHYLLLAEDIENRYSRYKELKTFLLDLPGQIAEQRERKDVGSDLLEEVDRYVDILDRLIQYCRELSLAMEVTG